MIALFRIDDRLVHAQVVVGWGRRFRPDRIIVADDEVASSEFETGLYTTAAEPDFKVSVMPEREAAERIGSGVFDSEECFLLVRGPAQALGLIDAGLGVEEINVGGLHYREGRERITENVWADPEERSVLREIVKKGITLEARALPGDERVTINSRVV